MANNNFGGTGPQFGINPAINTNSWNPVPIPNNNPSLSIMASNTREFAEQYPLAPNATMVFINYNQKKIWIKTMHANGLSYDFEDFNMFSDNDLAIYQQQVQNSMQQNQNGIKPNVAYVTADDYNALGTALTDLRKEFEALKKQFDEFVK